jgi:hypothetical protein
MPLNEASAPRSNLTAREKREALAALYGLPEPITEFEAQEISRRLFREAGEEPEQGE